MDSIYSFREARVLLSAFELGLFSHIGEGWKSPEDIANLAHTSPRATDRLLNALSSSGYLAKKKGKFSNTPVTSHFLVKGKPEYLGGILHQVSLWNTWSTLTEAVRSGSTITRREPVGRPDAHWLDSFIAAMHMRAAKQAPAIVKLLDLKKVHRVLDVGGGSGAFSMAFVRSHKNIEAVVFDLPDVIQLTDTYVHSAGLENLVGLVRGDFTIDHLPTGFDLVFLSAIIHSNSPETNKQLFKNAFGALNPNGQLVVLDYLMNDDRTLPASGAYFSLNMLVGTREGDTYTVSEVHRWMEEAGFRRIRRKKTPFETELIMGKK